MKILLFGEYSGFFNCLKDGLLQLGHNVFLASNGDGFKNFPSDFRWDKTLKVGDRYKQFVFASNIWWHRDLFKGYDIVMLISSSNISTFRQVNDPLYKYLIRNNGNVYLSGCGDTKITFDYWYNSDTKYRSYYEGTLIDDPSYWYKGNKRNVRQWEEELLSLVKGYIPIWYEYAEPYRQYSCLKKAIRIPVQINSQEYKPNIVKNDKVVFYHGINRECKGTRFIRKAFERMQKEYGEHAEFILAEKLPFDEYMKVIEKANVIVDDANSYSIAMNGLFSLLKGKLVMGGAEPVANKELGIDGVNPVFNINPDVDQICETIRFIIDHRDGIQGLGLKGRQFVENYHDSVKIAQEYVQLWEDDK